MNRSSNEFPKQIRQSSRADAITYMLSEDLFALSGREVPSDLKNNIIYSFDDDGISVLRADKNLVEKKRLNFLPVYVFLNSTSWAIGTGNIFIRFKEGILARSHENEINQAGYQISSVPDYAPHTAWLQSRTNNVSDGLKNIDKLSALPDIVHVEPQLLKALSKRNGSN